MYINIFVCTVNDQRPTFSLSRLKKLSVTELSTCTEHYCLTHAPTYNHTERNYQRS